MADVPKDSAVYSLLKEVFTAGRRATDLVQQILTFSRQAEHERKPVRLQPAVKEALKLLRASLPTTIEIRQNIDPACGPVLADPTQIHQVVMNLCANAYHAMREQGGLLTVTLDEIEVDAGFAPEFPNLEQCRCAKLCVADTGPGMDETTRARIFDPYFTTKQPGEGTGLGLSTVHGIVRSHEGAITVHTQPGNGAAFCVFLPIHTGAASATDEETAHRLFPRGVERILLIDDEEQVLELQKKLLERLGYAVKARTSSVEAFEAFRAAPDNFDLVITDQTMPYLTGDQLAKRILAIRPGMPIILCTGFSETLTDERAKAIGVREYIHKPIIAHEVAVCVRRVLDNALAAKAPDAEKSP